MSRIIKFSFVLIACTIGICYGDDATKKDKSEDLSKEEIYNINADIYCQTDYVIREKLLDVENPVNLYTSILGDDIKDLDCEAILKEYVLRVHKRLRKDFKTKGATDITLDCFMSQIGVLGYDLIRFRFNALYGIEIEKDKKEVLRKGIDKEISSVVEQAVDNCWPNEPSNNQTDQTEAVKTNKL